MLFKFYVLSDIETSVLMCLRNYKHYLLTGLGKLMKSKTHNVHCIIKILVNCRRYILLVNSSESACNYVKTLTMIQATDLTSNIIVSGC